MKYGVIKDSWGKEWQIAKLILGSVPFGTTISEEDSFALMDHYFEQGGNVIDTARVYSDWLPNGHGASERTIGNWMQLRKNREQIFLITKGGHPLFSDMHHSRLSAEEIYSDIEESLSCLQVANVDLYFLHRDDKALPVGPIMDALHELVLQGKAKMIGASNWSYARIQEANAYATAHGKTPFAASEIQWSYVANTPASLKDTTLETMTSEEYEAYLTSDLPVFAYSSQGLGVFNCGYLPDLSDLAPKHQQFYSDENIRRYQSLLKECKEHHVTPSRVVLEHITENKVNGFAIIGCSKKEQLTESLDALR